MRKANQNEIDQAHNESLFSVFDFVILSPLVTDIFFTEVAN